MATEATANSLAPALLRAAGLRKRYVQRSLFSRRKFVVEALKGVDLEIRPNCVTALVGESGSGKSSLAACLALLQKPDGGEIWFAGDRVSEWKAKQLASLRPKIQMVFQDSAGALNPRFSAAEIVAEPLEIQRRGSRAELRRRALTLMEEVGLSPESANNTPLQFSGGQRQRLALARAIALQPHLLILDESLSGLDLVTQAGILGLLADLRQRHSLTCLLISHDLSLAAQIAEFVAVMSAGSIVEYGPTSRVLSSPQHQETCELLNFACAVESGFYNTLEAGA